MASGYRIKNGLYSDADILALYIKYREDRIGPFTREVGDFIAHSKRDRGAVLDATAYMFAQIAFFQTYLGTRKIPLSPTGECGWWLRHYLLSKTKDAAEENILKHTGMTKKQARNAVKSWFDDKSAYPTKINCNRPIDLYNLASFLSKTIEGRSVFHLDAVTRELNAIFKREGIPETEIDNFLIGTAIILAGKSVEIVPGFVAQIKLSVGTPRSIPTGQDGRWPGDPEGWYVSPLPDGDLSIIVSTVNNRNDGLVSVALSFLETGVDTETYFSRTLVTRDEHGLPKLNFSMPLSFNAATIPKVDKIA